MLVTHPHPHLHPYTYGFYGMFGREASFRWRICFAAAAPKDNHKNNDVQWTYNIMNIMEKKRAFWFVVRCSLLCYCRLSVTRTSKISERNRFIAFSVGNFNFSFSLKKISFSSSNLESEYSIYKSDFRRLFCCSSKLKIFFCLFFSTKFCNINACNVYSNFRHHISSWII